MSDFRVAHNTVTPPITGRPDTPASAAKASSPMMGGDALRLSVQPLDVSDAAGKLIGQFGAEQTMLSLVRLRGGDLPPAEQAALALTLARTVGLKRPLSETEARDLDHYMTNYLMIQEAGNIKPDDGQAMRSLKTLRKEAMAVGAVSATIAYTALKGFGQATGVDVLDVVSGGRYQSISPTTSKASVGEVVQGLKGAWNGLIDS
jgi:hypothetical protein